MYVGRDGHVPFSSESQWENQGKENKSLAVLCVHKICSLSWLHMNYESTG